jgi:hypothetical protein
MPIYKGTTAITSGNLYKATTEIENGYKGTDSFYENSVPFEADFLIAGGGTYGGQTTYDYVGNTTETYPELWNFAGGGAGGVRTSFAGATPVANGGGQTVDSKITFDTNTTYTVVVGAVGTGDNTNTLGGETSIGSLVSVGGGGSSAAYYTTHGITTVATNGGGGGGGSVGYTGSGNIIYPNSGGVVTPVFNSGTYGFDGGGVSYVAGSIYRSGGGGGAGSVASNTVVTISGYSAMTAGGDGITSSITGSSATYGTGGNGIYIFSNASNAPGGRPAVTNPGSGGHAGGTENAYEAQSTAGITLAPTVGTDGCAIVRFPNDKNYTASGNPTLTTAGTDKILQWDTAGTYTISFSQAPQVTLNITFTDSTPTGASLNSTSTITLTGIPGTAISAQSRTINRAANYILSSPNVTKSGDTNSDLSLASTLTGSAGFQNIDIDITGTFPTVSKTIAITANCTATAKQSRNLSLYDLTPVLGGGSVSSNGGTCGVRPSWSGGDTGSYTAGFTTDGIDPGNAGSSTNPSSSTTMSAGAVSFTWNNFGGSYVTISANASVSENATYASASASINRTL